MMSSVAGSSTSNHVYIRSKEHAWVPCRLLETNIESGTATVSVQVFSDEQSILSGNSAAGSKRTSLEKVRLSEYLNNALPLQNVDEDGNLKAVRDMVDLSFLHEAAILYNLKYRHIHKKPYTRTGDIIIAMNPYQWIHDLYSEDIRCRYASALVWSNNHGTSSSHTHDPRRELEPHVYETSSLAYRGLAIEGQDQSILVSGESGAGKTETVKLLMSDIASVQRGVHHTEYFDSQDRYESPIVQRVLDSNPLLEAFGNAKTIRNDNSSRFGKYIQLQVSFTTK
jgi:myosin-5